MPYLYLTSLSWKQLRQGNSQLQKMNVETKDKELHNDIHESKPLKRKLPTNCEENTSIV